ncbi:signal recognition particle-docking protein FtsY [Oscillospiraceae bacterium HV4-5-C5C]|nr:signal recognition particle-docking protein FtsY [Oscillospiraceae bacterium HV4-5-C5C]
MGLLDKFKQGLSKTRDFLSNGIKQLGLAMGYFDENMIDELEVLLLQADAGSAATDHIMSNLRQDLKQTRDSSQTHVRDVLQQQMLEILGPRRTLLLRPDQLNIVLLIGVNGSGKTTTAGKLCLRYQSEGLRVLLAAADTFRAAAIEQLDIWATRTGTDIIRQQSGADPAAVVFDAVKAAQSRGTQVLIIDTAGRLHNKQNLMDELAKIRRIIAKEAAEANCQTILVADATSGQNAVIQAETFNKAAQIDGIALTKLDGNSKGGVALAIAQATRLPIFLAGLGEQAEDLVDFDPQAFVSSLFPEQL